MWVYDIETYFNFFSATFKNYQTKEVKVFTIFEDQNNLSELLAFVKDKWLVGYNNIHFDDQILYFLKDNEFVLALLDDTKELTKLINDLAQDLIHGEPKRIYVKNFFKYIDLMKAGNLNQKSLKMVGTLMKWHKLQDLPLGHDAIVTKNDVDNILQYNLNDVEITEKLLSLLEPQIKLRFDISKLYNVNVHSESDSGIANRLLEKFYSEATGIDKRDFKDLRTKRPRISFRDVVFTNQIQFKTKVFEQLLESVLGHTVYDTKPFFSKSVIYGGVKYKLGVGGLHSDDKPARFEANEKEHIIDCDIASMYPQLIINNNLHPLHLDGVFIKKYNDIKLNRIKAKKEGNHTIADTLKILLNSVYGKLKAITHWLYDPLAALRVTINGQLFVLMLIEDLVENGFKVISANTDGVVTIVPKNKETKYKEICSTWEKKTNFDLEYTYYQKYARRDVNNYVVVKEGNKVKTKGDFIYPKATEPQHLLDDPFVLRRGFDKPIIAKALTEYFMHNTPVSETIRNHKDIYDFCTSQKTGSQFENQYHTLNDNEKKVEIIQQSVRYFVSTDGGTLIKYSKENNKIINYCVGKTVTLFNDYYESDNYNIDYGYYINEAQKIIDLIDNPQLTLF